MDKGKYWLSGILLLVVLTSSIYLVLNDNVRIDIENTRSIFKVNENGSWVVSGIEYVNLFDGTAKMRASERDVIVNIYENDTIVTRTALYKNNISVIEHYVFKNSESDITLFPVSHSIEIIGADRPDRPYMLQYEVQKLLYTGETVSNINSPQRFGHQMNVEWQDSNYYSKIYKYSNKDEGKLTIKYKIDSDKFNVNVRLFDPPVNSRLPYFDIIYPNESSYNINVNTINFTTYPYNIKECWYSNDGGVTNSTHVANTSMTTVNNTFTEDSDIIYGIDGTGETLVRSKVFDMNDEMYMIITNFHDGFIGYKFINNVWTKNYEITNGLQQVTNPKQIAVFKDEGSYFLVGNFYGYNLTIYKRVDNKWELNKTISITDVSGGSAYINISGKNHIIAGKRVGGFVSFSEQSDGSWVENFTMVNGLSSISSGTYLSPSIVVINDKIYLTTGDSSTSMYGWVWTGASWNTSSILSGITSHGSMMSPNLFNFKGKIYAIVGSNQATPNLYKGWSRNDYESIPVISTIGNNNITVYCEGTDGSIGSSNIEYNLTPFLYSSNSDKTNASYIYTEPTTTSLYSTTTVQSILENMSLTTELNPTIDNFDDDGSTYAQKVSGTYGVDGAMINYGTLNTSKSYIFGYNTETGYHSFKLTSFCKQAGSYIYVQIKEGDTPQIQSGCANDTSSGSMLNITSSIKLYNYSLVNITKNYINTYVDINPVITTENITYNYYSLINDDITLNSSNYYATNISHDEYEYNYTPVYWDVSLYDDDNDNKYSLPLRYIGDETITISIDYDTSDSIAELGSSYTISASSDISNVSIDLVHPDYGYNYSSGFLSASFDSTINYFRRILFSDGNSYKMFDGSGEHNDTLYIDAHQYDEIDQVTFNITGMPYYGFPEDITIYKANSSEVDRKFPGKLIDNIIYQNKFSDGFYNKSLFFSSLAPRIAKLYMDSSGVFKKIAFDIYGSEYGYTYEDDFDDESKINYLNGNAMLRGGFGLPHGDNLKSFVYDEFTAASSLNDSLWTSITNGNYYVCGATPSSSHCDYGDEYKLTINNRYSDSKMILYNIFEEDYSGDERGSETINNYAYVNSSIFNVWTTQEIDVGVDYYMYGDEDASGRDCDAYSRLYIGDTLFWNSPWVLCEDDGTSSCNEYSESSDDFGMHIERNNDNSWTITLTGSESTYGDDIYDGRCGDYKDTYNYTSGIRTVWYQYTEDCPRDSYTETISNTKTIYDVNWNTTSQLVFSQYSHGYYDNDGNEGCDDITSTMTIDVFNHSLYNLSDAILESNSIFDSDGSITKSTMNSVTCTDCFEQNTSNSITAYLSSDNGDNFETITNGVETSFSNPGNNIKYKYDIDIANGGYVTDSPFLINMNVSTTKSYPSNLSIDFGDDNIMDYTFDGELNSSNSPTRVEISGADLSEYIAANNDSNLLEIPLKVYTESVGGVLISNVDFIYNPNPISLDRSSIYDFLLNSINNTSVPFNISSINGNYTIDDLKFDYAGGNNTYSIIAHNSDYSKTATKIINYFYSAWNYVFAPKNVYWIYFSPATPTSKDVTPYGQTNSIPIINLTNYGYGNSTADLSLYIDSSLDCVDMFYNYNSTKPTIRTDIRGLNSTLIGIYEDGLISPNGIATNGTNIFISDSDAHNVDLLFMNGTYIREFIDTSLSDNDMPGAIFVGESSIFINDESDNSIYVYNLSGEYEDVIDLEQYNIFGALGLTGTSNLLYVADNDTNMVYLIYTNGTYTGANFSTESHGSYNQNGIEYFNHELFITDYSNDEVLVWSTYTLSYQRTIEVVTTLPSIDIFVDNENLYILDTSGETIQKFSSTGVDANSDITIPSLVNSNPTGMAAYGSYIWVGNGENILYKHYTNGTYAGAYTTFTGATMDPSSFYSDGTYVWFTNSTVPAILKFSISGSFISSYDLSSDGLIKPSGITSNGTSFWVSDYYDKTIYEYDDSFSTLLDSFESPVGYVNSTTRLSSNTEHLFIIDNDELVIYDYYLDNNTDTGNEYNLDIETRGSITGVTDYNDETYAVGGYSNSNMYIYNYTQTPDTIQTEKWIQISTDKDYLYTNEIYLWADYDCEYSTWKTFQPTYYFRQCVSDGECSVEVI